MAANMDHGRVLMERKEFKHQLPVSVGASRAAPKHCSTPSADDIETLVHPAAIPYDELKKKIKCIVEDPPSADHFLTGSDNYVQWRVTILETLADADEAPNKLLAEAVISCLKGSWNPLDMAGTR
ncbi:hypothetical protein FOZ60_017036 [Perkinsus olseni]|uniref:Uncharacterized protein n=1 Tax=Perkinsus olseni TaxID=32597 RepID=A0A7J6P3G8_PEROL|nr:hypothetical protein FOZ60_017036 [Perkinsus olseni]